MMAGRLLAGAISCIEVVANANPVSCNSWPHSHSGLALRDGKHGVSPYKIFRWNRQSGLDI